jgi:hypothetical protein
MLLVTHILIALSSLLVAGLSVIAPTRIKLGISYLLVALTVLSGTILTLTRPVHLVSVCITGVVYLTFAFGAIIAANYRLTAAS